MSETLNLVEFNSALSKGAQICNLNLSQFIMEEFEIYYRLLIEENQKYNLTSITKDVEAAEKHFIDSLLLYAAIKDNLKILKSDNHANGSYLMVDIGSGAGFPGLPLKIYQPNIKLVLVEAVLKKVNFIQMVIDKLKLNNTNAIHARAEELSVDHRENYDVAVSRAVAELRVLVEYTLPYVKKGGIFVAAKGPGLSDEINAATKAINLLGGKVEEITHQKLPLSGESRTILVIRKVKSTPAKYPRRPGIPKKNPL